MGLAGRFAACVNHKRENERESLTELSVVWRCFGVAADPLRQLLCVPRPRKKIGRITRR